MRLKTTQDSWPEESGSPHYSECAVIGPFFNSEEFVAGWMRAIESQSYRRFKVYLIDDGSTDNTKRFLESACRHTSIQCEVLTPTSNVGPSGARNLGIRKAIAENYPVILLLDSDCIPFPNWVQSHLAFHQRRPDIDILGGGIEGRGTTAIAKADGFASWFTAVPYSKSGIKSRLHLSTTNMSIKATVFKKIGLFDEDLETGEDVAFCQRARAANLRIWLQSDIVIVHHDRESVGDAKRHHYRWGLHSYQLSIRNHGGYYDILKQLDSRCVLGLVPVIALLNTLLIVVKNFRRKPSVLLYLHWVFYLKWLNALGVYRGFCEPTLSLRNPLLKESKRCTTPSTSSIL